MHLSPSSVIVAVALLSAPALAQEPREQEVVQGTTGSAPSAAITSGTFGLSANVSGGGGGISLLYFLTDSSALTLGFGTNLSFIPFAVSGSVDLGYRMYLGRAGQVALFGQPSFGVAYSASGVSLGVSAGIGLEYYLTERLSTGVIASLGLSTQNLFQQISLGTSSSALFLNIYF